MEAVQSHDKRRQVKMASENLQAKADKRKPANENGWSER